MVNMEIAEILVNHFNAFGPRNAINPPRSKHENAKIVTPSPPVMILSPKIDWVNFVALSPNNRHNIA